MDKFIAIQRKIKFLSRIFPDVYVIFVCHPDDSYQFGYHDKMGSFHSFQTCLSYRELEEELEKDFDLE